MDPLAAFGLWSVSLVAIAALVKAASSAGAVPQSQLEDDDEPR